jgi:DNA replication initiation complex subunit (GINS family)
MTPYIEKNRMKIHSLNEDLKDVKITIYTIQKLAETNEIEYSKPILFDLNKVKEDYENKIQEIKNENYLLSIKYNFEKDIFQVSNDKIKLILNNEKTYLMVLHKFIKENKIANKTFNAPIVVNPTKKQLREFLINIK